MKLDISNLEPMKIGSSTQRVFSVTPGVLRNNLSEIIKRVYFCYPQHTVYVLVRGKCRAVISGAPSEPDI